MFGNWDLTTNVKYTSENFTQNFFGFGNNTLNIDNANGLNFNRVKTSLWSLGLGVSNKTHLGSIFNFKTILEGIEVQQSKDRFYYNWIRFC